jgi:hypothetical protein
LWQSLTWYTFTPLLVGEGVCLLLDAFVLLRTEAIPRLEMLWTLLRYGNGMYGCFVLLLNRCLCCPLGVGMGVGVGGRGWGLSPRHLMVSQGGAHTRTLYAVLPSHPPVCRQVPTEAG